MSLCILPGVPNPLSRYIWIDIIMISNGLYGKDPELSESDVI